MVCTEHTMQIYDLKGSLRGRFVQNPIQDEVLLDENLLQSMLCCHYAIVALPLTMAQIVTYASPICIPEHSKTLLGQAVWNDTAFLSSLNVMDYSLLVGIDSETNELVVGIIGGLQSISQYALPKLLSHYNL